MIRKFLRVLTVIVCMYVVAKWPNMVVITCESGVTAIGYLAHTIQERVSNERAYNAGTV